MVGEADEELGQDAGRADGLRQLAVGEPLMHRDGVDGLAAVVHVPQRPEDFLVGGNEEVILEQRDGGVVDDFVRLRHHTAEYRLLGLGAVEHGGRENVRRGGIGAAALGGPLMGESDAGMIIEGDHRGIR